MAKGKKIKKKKNMKLRRQLRKTLGCLFMISAIIVTAIPVQPLEAAITDTPTKVTVLNQTKGFEQYEDVPAGITPANAFKSLVPFVDEKSPIYSTGNGRFHFAYIQHMSTSAERVAVILGYNNVGSLTNNALTIPDKVDAYRKYSINTTQGEACAVSRSNEFLYYRVTSRVQDTNPDGTPMYKEGDEVVIQSSAYNANPTLYRLKSGNPATDSTVRVTIIAQDTPVMIDKYDHYPCYYSDRERWQELEDDQFYYDAANNPANPNYQLTTNVQNQRIHDALVAYIGNQKAVTNTRNDVVGEWMVGDYVTKNTPENGIFAGNNNIVSLTVGDNLMGIGDYAFYNCTGLQQVRLGNGLNTIGNGAFAECINMFDCSIDITAQIQAIGNNAFYNCVALTSFTVPTGLLGLGDSCFENCNKLKTVEFNANDKNAALRVIGDKVFKNCKALAHISFPELYREILNIKTVFDGCTGLKSITSRNDTFAFADGNADNFKDFIDTLGADFYFQAYTNTPLHNLAKKYGIAFKYYGEDVYEKYVYDGSPDNYTIWRVNSSNELIYFEQKGTINNLEVPSQIGPYFIQSIGANSFQNNCDLRKIIIPSSVLSIGNDAFKGCHNLKDVIFQEPINLTTIGSGAFATQQVTTVNTSTDADGNTTLSCAKCTPAAGAVTTNHILAKNPVLTFSGTVDYNSLPFKYAMNPTSTINNEQQNRSWITFYSGWPTNLTIQYNPNTDKNELIDYPLYNEIKNYSLDSFPYMTNAYVTEAKTAATAYENGTATEAQEAIVNAALNIVLPSGIESIKEGLFSDRREDGTIITGTSDAGGNTIADPDKRIKSITTNTVEEIPAYAFAGTSLESFYMGGGTSVGNYAFDGCPQLTVAEISSSVSALGLRPFKGCSKLTNVSFPNSENFTCENAVIFGKTNGVNTSVIECLETRGSRSGIGSSTVGPEELATVTSIQEEAFMDCDGVGQVDLSSSRIKEVPRACFAETDNLYRVDLPDSTQLVRDAAFRNSNIRTVLIPDSVSNIAENAFAHELDDGSLGWPDSFVYNVLFICNEDSGAEIYQRLYDYIDWTDSDDLKTRFTVYFFDAVDTLNPVLIGEPQLVIAGEDAVLPVPPEHEGYTFSHWYPQDGHKAVSRDNIEISAMYTPNDVQTWLVEFIDWDDRVIESSQVPDGTAAKAPAEPVREGYIFTQWRPSDFSKITESTKIYAQYERKDPTKYTVTFYDEDGVNVILRQQVDPGQSAVPPAAPVKEGYTFTGWVPANGYTNVQADINVYAKYSAGSPDDPTNPDDPDDPNNGGNNNNGNNNNGNNNSGNNNSGSNNNNNSTSDNSVSGNSTKYKVVVNGGSGSGDYTPGTIVNINAYATSDGRVFDKWTSSSYGVGFVNTEAISTTFTMPSNNVEITANFKTASSSSVSSNSRSRNRNTATTVDVTKSGISNTGLASANVNGSSDNYVIKITEDAQATAAVIAALENKYGDLSNIAYLPMDISLYDSTGQTQITDVSGISVDITLPLPDALVQYAGNNKAASVVNGQLEDLGTRFTTIDGVPCVQFTATHFSPYTIYVDKGNLTEGMLDATPKTGDPIHPKWFLAVGLACISIILFCKKDKGQPKVKAA